MDPVRDSPLQQSSGDQAKKETSQTDKLSNRPTKVTIGTSRKVLGGKISQTAQTTISGGKDLPTPPLKAQKGAEGGKAGEVYAAKESHNVEQTAKACQALTESASNLSTDQMMQRLEDFNKEMKSRWTAPSGEVKKGALFNSISCPETTKLSDNVHANWLSKSKDRSFAGFMYPSLETRAQALETFMKQGITRHAHLPNDFVVWLQHGEAGPVFPMSSETFSELHKGGKRSVMTEIGLVSVTYGEIHKDEKGQRYGSVTVSGDLGTRTVEWPLDSLQLREGLRIELVSTGDHDTYVYKDEGNKEVHSLEVNTILWKDFEGIHPSELHQLASRLVDAKKCSAGCRAGVGRTGTLFVATKMLQWIKDHPKEKISQKEVLEFIAEGRLNRDKLIVQTEEQLSLLMDYMKYLNDNPDLSLVDRMKRLQPYIDCPQTFLAKSVNATLSGSEDILTNPDKILTKEDEATLDDIYELLCDPISGESFKDPVLAPTGHTYERGTITKWLDISSTCPMTRAQLQVNDLKDDIFAQRLSSLLAQRAVVFSPKTEVGKAKMHEVDQVVTKEPLAWCRVLATVMPQNSYLVRMKGMGGVNDFVMEYRGKTKVQKIGFRVTDEGHLQPNGSKKTFANVQELALFLRSTDKKNTFGEDPSALTKENIGEINKSTGKEAFMANLRRDATLTTLVQHLEQRFEDKTVDGKIRRVGYVRAGINPSSFPCFTYVYPTGKVRCCIDKGRICGAVALNLKAGNKDDSREARLAACIKEINDDGNLSEADKKNFLEELKKVGNRLDFSTPVALFISTGEPVDYKRFKLATLEEKAIKTAKVDNYALAGPLFDE